jgi:hypothetical protein
MTTQRDPDRLIRAFLAEGRRDLPDRTYDAIRSEIERKRQRVVIGPWRLTRMNSYLKYAIAAAAVVIVAVVGINLMAPGGGQVGGPAATPTASPRPSPTPDRTAGPRPTDALPPEGPLAAGTYTVPLEGVAVSFTLTGTTWSSLGFGTFSSGQYREPDAVSLNMWDSAPDNVYSDPCAHTPLAPAASHTAAGLIAAAAAMPGVDVVSGPSIVTVGGRPAQTVAFTIRDDIGCAPDEFYLWYDDSSGGPDGGYRYAGALGSTHQAWAVDVDGKVIWIDAETFAGQGPEIATMVQQVIDSIQFN